jgi:hypothetical protein
VGALEKKNELNSFPWKLCEAQDSHTNECWFMLANLFLINVYILELKNLV